MSATALRESCTERVVVVLAAFLRTTESGRRWRRSDARTRNRCPRLSLCTGRTLQGVPALLTQDASWARYKACALGAGARETVPGTTAGAATARVRSAPDDGGIFERLAVVVINFKIEIDEARVGEALLE